MRVLLLIAMGLPSLVSAGAVLADDARGVDSEPAPLFVRVLPADVEPMPQYRALWSVEVNEEAIRQPARSIRLNGPDFPDIDVPLLRWSPRAGYIEIYNDDDPNPSDRHPQSGRPSR